MAFREVSVVQIREALRRWLKGEGERPIAKGIGVDRTTARRYITAAIELGLDRYGGEGQLTDELIGQMVERVRPHRPDGHGEAWRLLASEEKRIKDWVDEGITIVKIGILLGRLGVEVPHRTLARFAVERCGAGRRTTTVRVDDPPPGVECQVDFGRLGLVPDGEHRRVCWGLIFTACFSRHMFVWPTFRQTTEEVIKGFEAAWLFYGGVFPVVIPDNMKPIVIEAENTAPRFNESPQVSHEGEGLLDRRVHAGSRAGTTGAFPRADQMIGEAGHCRAQRLRSAFHASLTAAKREAGILVEPEGEVLADEELLQGARQRSGRTTGATRALKQRLGVQRAVGGEQSADGTDHETGTLNAVTLARELSKAW